MTLFLLSCLSDPMNWILVLMLLAGCSHILRRTGKERKTRGRVVHVGPSSFEALGAATLFLSTAYRPSQVFVARAQIQQHEAADDDGAGGPDTSRKHFLRQLRKIRRGEKLDQLTWLRE